MRPAPAILPALTVLLALAACKPPPTDADMGRDVPEAQLSFASDPLPSPDTEGAMWAYSPQVADRLIYGIPGEPALVSLDCLPWQLDQSERRLRITRISPADENADALLALVGNGHIGRIAVSAEPSGDGFVWQGQARASDTAWEPLTGARALGATVPGAGRVEINPSDLPGEFVEACRAGPGTEPPGIEAELPPVP